MSRTASLRLLRTAGGAALAVAALAPTGAFASTPAPGFEEFAGCPNRDDIQACQTIALSTGSLGLGKLSIPIAGPVHFAGGASNTDAGSFYVSDAGSVLSPVSLPVAGGAAGLTGDPAVGSEEVTAAPQLTTDPEFTVNGIRVSLRIAFSGAGLPESCGIGTADDPVVIDLTNGETTPPDGVEPIAGDPGSAGFDVLKSIVTSEHVVFVDNGYAVPAASGCGSSVAGREVGSVDELIDGNAGLPAAAGASQTFLRDATVRAAFDRTKVFG